MSSTKKTILIIEDDKAIRESVRILLEGDGFEVIEAENGTEGMTLLSDETSLVILDVMLAGKTGFEICNEIRQFSYVPILFLTAKSRENDKIMGFASGADDYLTKPFSYSELSARVKALIRRRQEYDMRDKEVQQNNSVITLNNITMNALHNQVYVNQRSVILTQTEYEILRLFMTYPQKIFSVKNIYESVWQEEFSNSISNTVMVHIRNLRAKIESDPQNPQIIITVWGKGYQFGKI